MEKSVPDPPFYRVIGDVEPPREALRRCLSVAADSGERPRFLELEGELEQR